MTVRGPRHSTISPDSASAAMQNGENSRDVTEALGAKLNARIVTVDRYTAVGSITAKIPLAASDSPLGVQLLTCREVYGGAAAVAALNTPNFDWQATTRAVNVFEPGGLVANTVYQLSFILYEV